MFTKKGMKRKIALTLGLSLFLAACGNEDSTANGKDVTLTYSIWDAIQEPGMQAIADAFEEENPEIKVNVEVTPWEQYWTKLESSAQGGACLMYFGCIQMKLLIIQKVMYLWICQKHLRILKM